MRGHRRRRRARPKLLRRGRRGIRFARDTLLYCLLLIVRLLLRAVPLELAVKWGGRIGRVAGRCLRRSRRRALRNLARAFPSSSRRWRVQVVEAVFANMGRSLVELLKIEEVRARLDSYVHCEGWEVLEEVMRRGESAIACTGHIGNWELLAAYFGLQGVPLTVVGRRLGNPLFNRAVLDLRSRGGVVTITRGSSSAAREILQALRSGKILAMLIDQDTRAPSVFVPFFGTLAATPSGPAMLALRSRVPVLVTFIARQPGGGHLITVKSLGRPEPGETGVHELTARISEQIEGHVQAHPTEWVWWHRRWRRQPP